VRIGVEVRALHHSYRGSGQWRYAFNLLREVALQDCGHDYCLFAPYRLDELDFPTLPSGFRYTYSTLPVPRGSTRQWLWEQLVLPIFLGGHGVAVCHFLLQMAPRWAPCKLVVTAYDAMYEVFPEYAKIRASRNYRWQRKALRSADRLLAISCSTKEDLFQFYQIKADRITVIPLAADPVFHAQRGKGQLSAVSRKYALPSRFVLSILSYEPRKNTIGVIKAFAQFIRVTGFPHDLVLFGNRGSGLTSDAIERVIMEAQLQQRVRLLGRVSDEELASLYELAEFFVFPSLYEGYGLPVVEALACGTSVLAADASSMPEVLGDAGMLVNMADVGALRDAMTQVASDVHLRHAMQRKALDQAKSFSWEHTARRVLQVYREVGGS
jgi:glycosyltransferase involved in cell wall biosynthesis